MRALDISKSLDDLKTVTLEGEEWSARDLLPFAGYTEWRKFSGAIGRTRASITASGLRADDHVVPSAKMVETGSSARRSIEDFRLTRYACYILFQNADARKPEIAALQQYFAVQTRKQELAPVAAPTGAELLALAVVEAQRMLAEKDQQIAELEPVAAESRMFRQSAGMQLISDFANDMRTHILANHPGVKFVQDDAFEHAARLGLIIRGNTVRHNQPTAQGISSGWVKPARKDVVHNDGRTTTKRYARLTPKGGARLWDGMLAYLRDYGTFEIEKKELSA